MFEIETQWVTDAARDMGSETVPLMKSCVFKHPSGFSWKFTVSVHGAEPNKYIMSCKALDIERRSLGVHDGWTSAQKLALKIVRSSFKHMFDAAQTAYDDFDNEAARIKFQKTMSALSILDAGLYVKTNDDQYGWVIEITECDPNFPASQPGEVNVFLDDLNEEKQFPYWEWPDHLEIMDNPYKNAKVNVDWCD